MVNNLRKISWEKADSYNLKLACDYIRKDFIQNAVKVRRDLISKIKKIPDDPEKYRLDKYRLNNDGTYRAFELNRYWIVYRVFQQKSK